MTETANASVHVARPMPAAPEERLQHLDTLRGFALFGILLVNLQFFTRPMTAIMLGPDAALDGADRVVDWWISALAEAKFYPLFSLLFGVGFALLQERAAATGRGFGALYARRLLVLAVFGAVHGSVMWAGDILLLYALAGALMLMFFCDTPPRRQLVWGVALVLTIPALTWWSVLSLEVADTGQRAALVAQARAGEAMLAQRVEASAAVYSAGSWSEAAAQTRRDFAHLFGTGALSAAAVLGLFLIGRWLLQTGPLRDPGEHRRFLARLMVLGLMGGGALSLFGTTVGYDVSWYLPSVALATRFTLETGGGVLLMLGYLATVLRFRHRLGWLAPAGQMALTNYLLQSLFWTALFYGWGLGLWGQIPRIWHPLLVVAFFAVQVLWSQWWMARFRYGPCEWLWRTLTYLRWQPMRRV